MSEKKYLNLLILCAILSLGIIVTFANDDIKKSLDILSRQKRVFSRVPGEDRSVRISEVPYVVVIKYNNRLHCVGSILSHHIVITNAACFQNNRISDYHIITSTARPNRGQIHDIIDVRKHFGNPQLESVNGVALLTVIPAIIYNMYTNDIQLHSEPLLPGRIATVSGWGFNYMTRYGVENNRGTNLTRNLRSIEVPIIAHRDCVNRYQNHYPISDQEVCTYHPQRHCGHNDFGAPLVVDGYLAGIYLWSGTVGSHDQNYPDVYVILQHSAFSGWIRSNIRNIEAQFQIHQH